MTTVDPQAAVVTDYAELALERPDATDLASLFAASDAFSTALYPAEFHFASPVAALLGPDVRFVVARVNTRPAGCGAILLRGDGQAELKRLIVMPDARGQGIGSRIIERLEAIARSAGASAVVIETGPLNHSAVTLYLRHGYRECDAFPPYFPNPFSLFMRKVISESEQ